MIRSLVNSIALRSMPRSFALIAYQLFEGVQPFQGMEALQAVRAAALEHKRPEWGAWRKQPKVTWGKRRMGREGGLGTQKTGVGCVEAAAQGE